MPLIDRLIPESVQQFYSRNQLLIIAVTTVLAIPVMVWLLGIFRLPGQKVKPFEAFSSNSAYILKLNNPAKLNDQFSTLDYKNTLEAIPSISKFQSDFQLLSSIFASDSLVFERFKNSQICAAPQITKVDDFEHLYSFQNPVKKSDFQNWLRKNDSIVITLNKFHSNEIYSITFKNNKKVVVCQFRNLLLFARNSFVIENGIKQLEDSSGSLASNSAFKNIEAITGQSNVEFSVLINFKGFELFSTLFKSENQNLFSRLANNFSWWGLDFLFEPQQIQTNGFLLGQNTPYLKTLTQVSPSEMNKLAEYLPSNTSFFSYHEIGTSRDFMKRSEFQVSEQFSRYIIPWMEGSYTFAVTEPTTDDCLNESFALIKANNTSKARTLLEEYSDISGGNPTVIYQNHKIQHINERDLFLPLFGEESAIQQPYYTDFDSYFVFANSLEDLKRWIDRVNFNETLQQNPEFQLFKKDFAPESIYSFFVRPGKCYLPLTYHINSELHGTFDSQFEALQEFNWMGLQLNKSETGQFFTHTISKYAPDNQPVATNVSWRIELESDIKSKPYLTKNHRNKEWEVVVQDRKNNLYQISKSGNINWRLPIKEAINSPIYQIDYYNNGFLQYAFSTKKAIYIIDRNGEEVVQPIKFPAMATNGLAVFDYGLGPRFFIACKNGNIYGYEKSGKPLKGWNPNPKIGIIASPLQHIVIGEKDFILAQNKKGRLFLFKRDGSLRIDPVDLKGKNLSAPQYDLNSAARRIVSADKRGKLRVSNFEGKVFNLLPEVGNNKNVKFVFEDILGDSRKDYAVLSGKKLTVYAYEEDESFKKQFETSFSETQASLFPVKLKNSKKSLLGTVSKRGNRIYLLREDGNYYPGFPLAGTGQFVIGDLYKDNSNILIVAEGRSIYSYKLK